MSRYCVCHARVYYSIDTLYKTIVGKAVIRFRVMNPGHLFQLNPSSGVPIYRQLMDQVRSMVATGRLPACELLPSVRQIAESLQVNPMTVSKAYSLLERDGVIERVRGQGMRVLPPTTKRGTVKERQQALEPLLEQLVSQAAQLGLTDDQLLAAIQTHLKDSRQKEARHD